MPRIDYTAARVVRELQQNLTERGVALVFDVPFTAMVAYDS